MNNYSKQEQSSAELLYDSARGLVRLYAELQDREVAAIAVLAEALVLAGGENLLTSTKEKS